jgi:hypothetical protein
MFQPDGCDLFQPEASTVADATVLECLLDQLLTQIRTDLPHPGHHLCTW